MFGWIKRKVEIASINAATNDIDRFIKGLQGSASDEIAAGVAMATMLRLGLESIGKLPRFTIDLSLPRDQYQADMTQLYLSQAVKEFQKMGQPTDAYAAMVWLHSVRALNIPEVRYLGRAMWGQLQRGFGDAADATIDICTMIGRAVPANIHDEVRFIPVGLEPI